MPFDIGRKLVVDGDVAALVGDDAGLVEAEIVGVRRAAGGDQHVACLDWRLTIADADADAVGRLGKADPVGIGVHANAFRTQDICDRVRDIRVLARRQAGPRSITVTSAPKRRYICANSRPM